METMLQSPLRPDPMASVGNVAWKNSLRGDISPPKKSRRAPTQARQPQGARARQPQLEESTAPQQLPAPARLEEMLHTFGHPDPFFSPATQFAPDYGAPAPMVYPVPAPPMFYPPPAASIYDYPFPSGNVSMYDSSITPYNPLVDYRRTPNPQTFVNRCTPGTAHLRSTRAYAMQD